MLLRTSSSEQRTFVRYSTEWNWLFLTLFFWRPLFLGAGTFAPVPAVCAPKTKKIVLSVSGSVGSAALSSSAFSKRVGACSGSVAVTLKHDAKGAEID